MGDLFADKAQAARKNLKNAKPDQVMVDDDHVFVGFDAYKKAIDILRPGDVAMCTTRAYIRPVHVEYAVKKGIHVFMEKPVATDAYGVRLVGGPMAGLCARAVVVVDAENVVKHVELVSDIANEPR